MTGALPVFTLRRMRRRAAAFAGLLAIASVTAAMTAAATGLLVSAATTGVRAAIERQPGSTLALRSTVPLDDDIQAQDARVRSVLRAQFGVVPITVVRAAGVTAQMQAGGESVRTFVATVEDFPAAATLVAGTWPADGSEAALQADASAELGIAPGDRVTIGGTALTVTATWRVADGEDPRWLGERIWSDGGDGSQSGPLIIADGAWSALGLSPRASWTVIPRVDRLDPGDLSRIAGAWDRVPDAFRDAGLGSPTQAGRFLRAADAVVERLAALAAIGPAAAAVVAAVAVLALWSLVSLLVADGGAETLLMRARGVTATRLALTAASVAGLVAGAGGLAGAAAGVAGIALAAGVAAVVPAAVAGAVAAAATALVSGALVAVRTATLLRGREASTGASRFAGLGAVVLLAAAAGVSAWQLLRYGAVGRAAHGGAGVDPIAVVAPALVMAAVVVAGAAVFPRVARASARDSARRRGPALASRAVARGIVTAAVPVVLVGIAMGQVAVAAGYAATWRTSFDQMQGLALGTALRITGDRLDGAALDAAAAASGVQFVAPVRVDAVAMGGVAVPAVGVAPAALAAAGSTGGGLVDPGRLADVIAGDDGAPMLPDGATTATITTAPATDAGALWIVDEVGRMIRLDLAPVTGGVGAALPEGRWRLAAIDLALASSAGPVTVAVSSLTTDAGPVPLARSLWRAAPWQGTELTAGDARSGLVAQAPPSADGVRFIATAAGGAVIAVSRPLAATLGVQAGDVVGMETGEGRAPLTARIGDVVAAIPGAGGGSAVLVDVTVLDAADLAVRIDAAAPSIAWIGTADVPTTAAALRAALPPEVGIDGSSLDPDLVMLAAAPEVLWLAAIGCVVLALSGVIAAAIAQVRTRRDESAVLAAIGMSPREQARSRRAELSVVIVWGAVVGLLAGGSTVLIVIATLARSAVPDADASIPTAVRFDAGAFTAVACVVGLAAAAVVVGYGRAVARAARRVGAPGQADAA